MFTVAKYGRRHWAVLAPTGELVCVTLYRKGAEEVARRLSPKGARRLYKRPGLIPTMPIPFLPLRERGAFYFQRKGVTYVHHNTPRGPGCNRRNPHQT